MKIQRQGIKNAVVSYVGIGLGYLNTGLLFPNFMSTEQVGLVSIMLSAATIYAQLSAFGIPNMTMKYFPYFKDPKQNHKGFLLLQNSILITSFICVSLLVLLLQGPIEDFYIEKSKLFIDYFYLLPFMAFFMVLFNATNAFAMSVFKSVHGAFYRDVWLRFTISICIFIYAMGWVSFKGFMFLYISCYLVEYLFLLVHLNRAGEFRFRLSFSKATLGVKPIKELIKFGAYSLLSNATNQFTVMLDALMIGAMIGLAEVGIYTRAIYFSSVMLVPARALYRLTFPTIAQYMKNDEHDKIHQLYKKVATTNILGGGFIFALIYANINELYSFMPEVYATGITAFLIVGTGRLFDIMTGSNAQIILASKYYKVESLFNVILALLTISFNYVLINAYGMNGAAIATALAIVSVNVLRTGFLYFTLKMWPIELRTMIGAALIAFLVAVGHFMPQTGQVFIDLILGSAIITIVFATVIMFTPLSPELRDFANKMLRQIRQFLPGS